MHYFIPEGTEIRAPSKNSHEHFFESVICQLSAKRKYCNVLCFEFQVNIGFYTPRVLTVLRQTLNNDSILTFFLYVHNIYILLQCPLELFKG